MTGDETTSSGPLELPDSGVLLPLEPGVVPDDETTSSGPLELPASGVLLPFGLGAVRTFLAGLLLLPLFPLLRFLGGLSSVSSFLERGLVLPSFCVCFSSLSSRTRQYLGLLSCKKC